MHELTNTWRTSCAEVLQVLYSFILASNKMSFHQKEIELWLKWHPVTGFAVVVTTCTEPTTESILGSTKTEFDHRNMWIYNNVCTCCPKHVYGRTPATLSIDILTRL